MGEAPEDSSKQAEDSSAVGGIEVQPPQQKTDAMAVGGLHDAGGIIGLGHYLFNQAGENVQVSRGGGLVFIVRLSGL